MRPPGCVALPALSVAEGSVSKGSRRCHAGPCRPALHPRSRWGRRLACPRVPLAAAALLALTGPAWSQPHLTRDGDRIVVANDHYRATLAASAGGLIESLAMPDGRFVTLGHTLYTDRGLGPDGVFFGSSREAAPTVEVTEEAGEVIVRSRGRLCPDPAPPAPAGPDIRYTVEHRFDATTAIRIAWTATAVVEQPWQQGFFAYLLSLPPGREWFADTLDGRLYHAMDGAGTRTFQSMAQPLSLDRPLVGVLLESGPLIALSDLRSSVPFANVFLHENADRSSGLFFARLDGSCPTPVEGGIPWEASFTLHISPSLQEWQP